MKSTGGLRCWVPRLLLIAAASSVSAADWQIVRFDGRDYVSLENIAAFYGFPPPPALPAPPVIKAPIRFTLASHLPVSAPQDAPPPLPANLSEPVTLTLRAAPLRLTPEPFLDDPVPRQPRVMEIGDGHRQITVSLNSREIFINGARQWLCFATHVQDGHLLLSRMDLAKTIEPRLRPERIEGMDAVRTVVLDPGHGGHDKGALSPYGAEKDFALDVALRVRELLVARGFNVAMTRTTDVFIPLEQRPNLARNLPDSIFVSIHFNASNANLDASGFEIFSMAPRGAPATNDESLSSRILREEPGNAREIPSGALASAIYHSLLGNVQSVDRGIKNARFAVLRLSTVPAVLIECGFVTNGPESLQIGSPEWRLRVAQAIVEGIDGYKELAEHKLAPKLVADYLRPR